MSVFIFNLNVFRLSLIFASPMNDFEQIPFSFRSVQSPFENRVLRRTFGPMRDETIGGWTKLHNEEIHNLFFSPSIIRKIKSRRMRWAGNVARMEEKRNAYNILVGKPGGKRPLGRPRHRWVDNIKIDLREIGWGSMDWIDLAQGRDQWRALVNKAMNLRVP
jgi:hypothetical protein